MKKISKLIISLLCVVSVFCSAIQVNAATTKSDGKNMKMVLKYYGKKDYKKAKKYNKKLSKYAKEACTSKMTKNMKKAYLKVVKKYNKNADPEALSVSPHVMGYYLTDIDNDKKAELIVEEGETLADAQFYVFQYKNGKAKKVGSMSAYHLQIYAYPGHQGFIAYGGYIQYERMFLVTIKKGKLYGKKIGSRDNASRFLYLRCAVKSHASYDKDLNFHLDYSPLQ